VSGSWSLPSFNVQNAAWSAGNPNQFVDPHSTTRGSFTWTLTVRSASGQTATDRLTFSVVAC
jgi:hypothetical protein